MTSNLKEQYTVKELAALFQLSHKATIRHLRHFNIPLQTKERFKSHVATLIIKDNNPELFHSMELAVAGKVKKPFFTIKDLCPMFYKTHSGMYRWIKRYQIPTRVCGNKTVLLASVLLQLEKHSAP
jgi:hypothetical protein